MKISPLFRKNGEITHLPRVWVASVSTCIWILTHLRKKNYQSVGNKSSYMVIDSFNVLYTLQTGQNTTFWTEAMWAESSETLWPCFKSGLETTKEESQNFAYKLSFWGPGAVCVVLRSDFSLIIKLGLARHTTLGGSSPLSDFRSQTAISSLQHNLRWSVG